jgi:hypothetical protein
MKNALSALLAVILLDTPALAEDKINTNDWLSAYRSLGVSTFAATGKPVYGVHTEGDLERGYYYQSRETSVQFYICPSGPVISLDVSKIAPETRNDCSVPGRPEPPISGYLSAKWTYDDDKLGFIVSTRMAQQSAVIPCKNAPMKMLAAAKFAQAKEYGIVADANDYQSKEVAKYLSFDWKNLELDGSKDVPSEQDCANAGVFWTYPIGEPFASDKRKALAVTTVDPFPNDK